MLAGRKVSEYSDGPGESVSSFPLGVGGSRALNWLTTYDGQAKFPKNRARNTAVHQIRALIFAIRSIMMRRARDLRLSA
jgi:hypothetical protein